MSFAQLKQTYKMLGDNSKITNVSSFSFGSNLPKETISIKTILEENKCGCSTKTSL